MAEFKVGDRVADTYRGLSGVITADVSGGYMVLFDGQEHPEWMEADEISLGAGGLLNERTDLFAKFVKGVRVYENEFGKEGTVIKGASGGGCTVRFDDGEETWISVDDITPVGK